MRAAAQLQATIELLDSRDESSYPADRVMAGYFRERRYIGAKDKAVISEQFYALLRNRLSYTYLIEQTGEKTSNRLLASILLLEQDHSLTMIASDYFNGQQYHPRKLSKSEQLALEKTDFSQLKLAPMHVQLNVPDWIATRLEASLGERYQQEMAASNERASTDIRVNTLKSTIKQVSYFLKQSGYKLQSTSLSAWGLKFNGRVSLFNLDAFKNGWFEIQDEGSQLLAQLSAVKAGDRVVDFCAGAGGKALAMAAMMQNKGSIVACDVHSKRLQQTVKRAKRAGVHNIRTQLLKTEKDKWVKQHAGKNDVVLIDAPCSGTGTWRRSPDSRWNLTEQDLKELVALQQSILQSASRLVKPGGRLIYATCSLLKEENEQQVADFLNQNADFNYGELEMIEPLKSNLDKVRYETHQLRTLPALTGTDGFYVCALDRKNLLES